MQYAVYVNVLKKNKEILKKKIDLNDCNNELTFDL